MRRVNNNKKKNLKLKRGIDVQKDMVLLLAIQKSVYYYTRTFMRDAHNAIQYYRIEQKKMKREKNKKSEPNDGATDFQVEFLACDL